MVDLHPYRWAPWRHEELQIGLILLAARARGMMLRLSCSILKYLRRNLQHIVTAIPGTGIVVGIHGTLPLVNLRSPSGEYRLYITSSCSFLVSILNASQSNSLNVVPKATNRVPLLCSFTSATTFPVALLPGQSGIFPRLLLGC